MKILASSIADSAQDFLHAGYISAYPRVLRPDAYLGNGAILELDVAEALRLKGEAVAAATTPGGSVSASGLTELLTGWPVSIVLLSCLGLLATWLVWGGRMGPNRRLLAAAIAGVWVAMALGACRSAPPPWQGVERQAYLHPEMATQVLLHGIIGDGLINANRKVETLADIQDEVGLPSAELTRGEIYALRTYGFDGWGREFRLIRGESLTVTSAGADGAFGTSDDLSVVASPCDNENWDEKRHAFFVLRKGSELAVAFHRWKGSNFQYRNKQIAQALTGSDKFDVLADQDLVEGQHKLAQAARDRLAAAVGHEPLVLQVF